MTKDSIYLDSGVKPQNDKARGLCRHPDEGRGPLCKRVFFVDFIDLDSGVGGRDDGCAPHRQGELFIGQKNPPNGGNFVGFISSKMQIHDAMICLRVVCVLQLHDGVRHDVPGNDARILRRVE